MWNGNHSSYFPKNLGRSNLGNLMLRSDSDVSDMLDGAGDAIDRLQDATLLRISSRILAARV